MTEFSLYYFEHKDTMKIFLLSSCLRVFVFKIQLIEKIV